jgi:hypothetical protein
VGHYLIAQGGIGLGTMNVFDLSDPADPRWRASYTLPQQFYDVEISGDLLFVADGFAGVLILRLHPDRFLWSVYLPRLAR